MLEKDKGWKLWLESPFEITYQKGCKKALIFSRNIIDTGTTNRILQTPGKRIKKEIRNDENKKLPNFKSFET